MSSPSPSRAILIRSANADKAAWAQQLPQYCGILERSVYFENGVYYLNKAIDRQTLRDLLLVKCLCNMRFAKNVPPIPLR
eukprot:scaffold27899_cov183-Skeletonema_menzelii.AAC.2